MSSLETLHNSPETPPDVEPKLSNNFHTVLLQFSYRIHEILRLDLFDVHDASHVIISQNSKQVLLPSDRGSSGQVACYSHDSLRIRYLYQQTHLVLAGPSPFGSDWG